MGQYRPMRRNKGSRATVVVLAGVLAISLVLRLIGRTPHRPVEPVRPPAPAAPQELAHPFVP
jgi:hypothetical protein